ncbi:hypothetical protein BaRGS_00024180 [Batillaria attramentaria]|uniref:Alpha-methylacyl-CoA racemase n=1 Tax=Batillaria attramentaria TaxID=370345 RepID=A0ABD0KBR1_9CAEN
MALKGIRVIELAGLAPSPFCGMILADFGAKVIRVDRPNALDQDVLGHGKRSIAVNLKKTEGATVLRRLCQSADVLVDPYRPGIMERLGLGPDILMKENPRLVYARLSGFGQSGPLAASAGHDINYIAVSGLLSLLGRKGERPYPPINLLADFAGGGLMCALGIVLSLFERQTSGQGQVVDANMVQGSAYVGSWLWSSQKLPMLWGQPRGENLLDGGRAFYDVYETKDGKFMSVGALEPQFYKALLKGLNIDPADMHQFEDPAKMRKTFQEVFKTKTRDEWAEVFSHHDTCVQPVLDQDEAPHHPHNQAIQTFVHNADTGSYEPAPAPRLSRTPGARSASSSPKIGQHTVAILKEAGMDSGEISNWLRDGIVVDGNQEAKL